MTPEQAQALVEQAEHPLVQWASQEIAQGAPLVIRKRLEQEFSPPTCRAILDCLQSRVRFAKKFEEPGRWLLQGAAAEQATPSAVARWRADFLRQRCPESGFLELGCGVGGDSVYLSQHFQGTALEMEPSRAILAKANVSRMGSPLNLEVLSERAEPSRLKGRTLFCDPARRTQKREFNPQNWNPPLASLLDLYEQGRFTFMGLKCAPGLRERPPGSSVHFVSLRGQLKEAFLWFSAEQEPVPSTAWLLGEEQEKWCPTGSPAQVRQPVAGEYLHNPDSAILRAQAADSLAHTLEAGIVHPKIGYLVGPKPCRTQAAASFLIHDTLTLNWKKLSKALVGQGWSEYEYLGRGVPFSQSQVRKHLAKSAKAMKAQGQGRGAVIIYRAERDYTVVLATRATTEGKASTGCE